MDVLSQVFQTLQVEGNIYFHSEFTAPWGFTQTAVVGAIFHIVKRGSCWLRLVGEDRLILLNTGDIVVILGDLEHQLFDKPDSPTLPLKYLMDKYRLPEENGLIRYGGGGEPTWLICGEFQPVTSWIMPLLSSLPPLVHLKSEQGKPPGWLEILLKYLAIESENNEPGSRLIVSRLLDVMFIEILRNWITNIPSRETGWLEAFSDRHIGKVLAQLYNQPGQDWTVDKMAQVAGLSRAAFASRFKHLLGESPLKYLTGWRMELAAARLKADKLPVALVAQEVGYASLAAFTRTFERYMGITPGAYRNNR